MTIDHDLHLFVMALTWRPQGGGEPTRWNGYDDAGQLRGWVWMVGSPERPTYWLCRISPDRDSVVGLRATAEDGMALVDERVG